MIAFVLLCLAIVVIHHWPLYQLDIKNVFLHGELHEEVCLAQPLGFIVNGASNLVSRLRRSLYGLKQSPRAWFGRFINVLQECGMTSCEANYYVFSLYSSPTTCIYLIVYVNDIIITGKDKVGINS
jgi:hypothetical protein